MFNSIALINVLTFFEFEDKEVDLSIEPNQSDEKTVDHASE